MVGNGERFMMVDGQCWCGPRCRGGTRAQDRSDGDAMLHEVKLISTGIRLDRLDRLG